MCYFITIPDVCFYMSVFFTLTLINVSTCTLQMGEAEWYRLSEAERQKRLMELKLKERMLRQQGRHDDAAVLIQQHLRDSETLRQLIGDEMEEYERRLRERRERKRRRIAESRSNHSL